MFSSFTISSEDSPPITVKVEETMADTEDDRDELEGELSEHDELDPPATKRIRTRKTVISTHKRVRGKQGRLKNLMNMPTDIFTQIVYWLNPGDLISLVRANKFFRNMLLQRSNVHIWRRAESNISELPPCPNGLCEPQYAALIFSKHCTYCGASATSRPDANLLVRLCTPCRNTQLIELGEVRFEDAQDSSLVHRSCSTKLNSSKVRPRGALGSPVCLKSEVSDLNETRRRYRAAKDNIGWEAWKSARCKAMTERSRYAVRIHWYIRSTEQSREKELGDVRKQRRETIVSRLREMGWTNRDMIFDPEHVKSWRALVEVSKPLTERVWGNMLPKLTLLLEENRAQHLEDSRLERRMQRRKHIDKFLTTMKYSEHPLEPIIQALGAQLPARPDSEASFHLSASEDSVAHGLENAFPNTQLALDWDCLADLNEQEIAIEEVQAELDARREQVRSKVLEWRVDVEKQLVEQYQDGVGGVDDNIVVTVKGSTELTTQLSPELRLLLRADTVFKRCESNAQGNLRQQSNCSYHYPRLVCSLRDMFDDYELLDNPNFDLRPYRRHTGTEKVIKKLLQCLGMPDVAYIELFLMRARFVCGRCTDEKPKTWDSMVRHYVTELKRWNKNKNNQPVVPVRYPITYRNVHDLESQDNPKPLVRIVTDAEARFLLQPSPFSEEDGQLCLMCDATVRGCQRLPPDRMIVHMLDVHNISAPVEHVHWGTRVSMDILTVKWTRRWNAFYDAQVSIQSL